MDKVLKNLMVVCITIILSLSIMATLSLTNKSIVHAQTVADTSWWSEDKNEFEISTAGQLLGLAEIVNSGEDSFADKTITLNNDIDLSGINWTPIGCDAKKFGGVFDGANHSINNLNIKDDSDYSTDGYYLGMFGCVLTSGTKKAGIKNVNLTGKIEITNFRTRGDYESGAGGIVGFINNGYIDNCSFTGSIVGGPRIGGIVGTSYRTAITKCSTIAKGDNKLSGYINSGGIVGYMGWLSPSQDNPNLVENCTFEGTIVGNANNIGGIVGTTKAASTSDYSTIKDCAVLQGSEITGGTNNYIGGIAGTNTASVINCINMAKVSGKNYIGGIAGQTSGLSAWGTGIEQSTNVGEVSGTNNISGISYVSIKDLLVINCCNRGKLIADSTKNVAGLVYGSSSGIAQLSSSYNIADIEGGNKFPITNNAVTTNCYYDSSLGESAVGEAKVTEDFANRTVVDLLNGDTDTPVWFQNVDYPDFATNMTPVENLTVEPTTEVDVTKEVALNAVVDPEEATNKGLVFTSSDEEVATVAADGKVTGVKAGEAEIMVMALYDGKKAVCKVTVKDPDKEAADAVIAELKAIDPEKATLEELEAVQKKYDALTPEQKALVDADADAAAAKDAIDSKVEELNKAAAQKVIDAIKAVDPSTATEAQLKAVQDAYNALTPAQKAIVDADPTAAAAKKAIDAKAEEMAKGSGSTQTAPTTQTAPATTSTTVAVKKGTKFNVKGYKYTVTSNLKKTPTVTITGYKNKKLKKISVPASVKYKKVTFKVTAIGNKAFKGQKKATAAVIGKNIKTIGANAFAGDAKLKKITVKSTGIKKVGAKAFKGIHKKAVIKVPAKKLKAYKKLFKGKGQKKTVKIKK